MAELLESSSQLIATEFQATPPELKDAIDFSKVRRVLVVKLRYHGDVLLSTPVFSALKAQHPHLEIDALIYAETRDMLSLHPDIHTVHCIDRKWKNLGAIAHLGAEINLLKQLKARHYDLLIHLTEHWRGPLLKRLLGIPLAIAAQYSRRAHSRWWRNAFTHHYRTAGLRHKVEVHLDALRRVGVYPTERDSRLKLIPGDAAATSAGQKLHALGLSGRPFILLHPTSRFFYKCWTVDGMAQLIEHLQQRYPVLITAAPAREELNMVDAILARTSQRPASLAGQLSLKELAWCIEQAQLFVGVDSAPMHIAAAMQTPLVALFGPTNEKSWAPWHVQHRIVRAGLSCQPCQLRGCADSHISECLMMIRWQQVADACDDLLGTNAEC